MASNHNNLDVNAGAPAQHDPLVATPLQQQHDTIQSVPKIEVEDAAQDLLHYISTDNVEKISRSHVEARTDVNRKAVVITCVPVLATPQLHCVLEDQNERDGTKIPCSCDICPELTDEISQHIKQVQATPPARTKNQVRYKFKQVPCNLSASYSEYRHRRICSMKARAAAAAANSWPPGILARIWAALKFVFNLRFLLIEWCLLNINPLGPLAPLIFSLVYAIVGYWFVYSDPFEGLLIKIGINILSIVWTIDFWPVFKSDFWPSRPQADRDNTLEYFHQLNYERASILGSYGIS